MAKAPRVPGATTTSEGDAPEPKAENKAQPLPETPRPPMPEGIPNAVDVDPTKITGPVLSRQGWICPVEKAKG
jgi:hypothetical protein